jgi:hypothetical protein
MLEAVTLISLLNTGANLVGSFAQGVGNAIGGQGEGSNLGTQSFAGLLSSTQSSGAIGLDTKTSLDITQQGAINAAPIVNTNNIVPAAEGLANQNSDQITDATLEALNKILSGDEKPYNVEILADDNTDSQSTDETNANSGGILGNTKLNDPFGIEAAKANGSPIAVANIVPAESLPNTVNPETGEVLVSSEINNKSSNNLNSASELQNKSLTNSITIQNKAEANAEKLDAESANKLAAENIANKELKPSENKPSTAQSGLEKVADKIIHNPNSPYYGLNIGKDENRAIGDAARSIRNKDSAQEKLADVDSYKVVNVSRKDNILDLRLEPAALGKVQIKFDFAADGKTNVMVIADRQETLDMMKRDTDSIQKLLSDNGIKAESGSLSFNLRGQQQNNDNFNFFSGKPISFGVQEELNKLAANDDLKSTNLNGYGIYAGTGLLNIMV